MMKVRSILKCFIILFVAIFVIKSCIRVDLPESDTSKQVSDRQEIVKQEAKEPFKTVYKNGRDWMISRGEVGKYGGVLRTSSIGEGPKTFNPWNAKDATSGMMSGIMFDGLVGTDAYTGEVIPKMAKSIEVSPDGLEYKLTLRRGLRWSDGKPITADDVLFTWKDIVFAGFGNTSTRDNLVIDGKLPTIKKVDDYTVVFKTPVVFAPFLRQLGVAIAPKHIVEPVVKKGKEAFNSFWGVTTKPENFVVSGPFKLDQYVPAQRVSFKRNDDYYMMDADGQSLPYLDKYVVYIVGDLNNEVLKFEAGEIDVLSVRGNNVARFKALEKNNGYKMYNLGPDTGTVFVAINLNDRKNKDGKYYVPKKKQKWLGDINFRRAISYAIDRNAMVSNVLYGVGAPLYTAESLSSIYLNKGLAKGYSRDIKKAKELLVQSGFYYKDGKLFDKNNCRVELELLTNAGNTERESVGVIIKQDLADIGIKVNFKPIEFNSLVGKLVNTFDWDMVIIGLTGSPLDPHSGKNVWSYKGSMHLFNMNDNTPSGWEKELDSIFEKGAKVLGFDERKKYYDKYQKIVYDEVPMVYLYSSLSITAIRNKFGNISPTTLGGSLHNVEEIYVK